jgi:hypothetical protein
MLLVSNDGPLITATNFWDLPEQTLGKFYVSLNAGAFRLLVPDVHRDSVDEMATAKGVAVSRGPWPAQGLGDAFELLFDDGTSNPFALHVSPQSFDRVPTAENVAGDWAFTAWTRPRRGGGPHLALRRPCRYRLSTRLPDLRPWEAR